MLTLALVFFAGCPSSSNTDKKEPAGAAHADTRAGHPPVQTAPPRPDGKESRLFRRRL